MLDQIKKLFTAKSNPPRRRKGKKSQIRLSNLSISDLESIQKSKLLNILRREDVKEEVEKLEKKYKGLVVGGNQVITTPIWQIYANMYYTTPFVQSGINKKTQYIKNAFFQKGILLVKDNEGYPHEQVAKDLNRFFDFNGLIEMASIQYHTFNNCIYSIIESEKKFTYAGKEISLPFFKIIPPSEINTVQVSKKTFDISSFSWSLNEVYSGIITKFDREGNQNFLWSKGSSLESQFFGDPFLASLYSELDGYLRDKEAYTIFQKNAFFPSAMILMTEEASVDEGLVEDLDSLFQSMRTPENKFRGLTVKNAFKTYDNGDTVQIEDRFRIETFKPEYDARLSLDEQKEIKGLVYDAIQIPRVLMGAGQGSLSSGKEYESSMIDFAIGLEGMAGDILEDLNSFILPEALKALEKAIPDYFSRIKKRPEDFSLDIHKLDVELPSAKRESYVEAYNSSLITRADAKRKGFGYLEKDLETDDEVYKLPAKTTMVPAGQTKDQFGQTIESQDPSTEELEAEKIEEKQAKAQIAKLEKTLKDGKARKPTQVRRKIRKLKEQITKAEFSRVPELLKKKEVGIIKEEIKKAYEKQYKINLKEILERNDKKTKAVNKELADTIMSQIEIDGIRGLVNKDLIRDNLIQFATLELEEAIRVAEQNGETFSQEDRKKMQSYIENSIEAYLDNQFTGEFLIEEDLVNKKYDGDLNTTTREGLAFIIASTVEANPDLSISELEKLIEKRIKEEIETRSGLFAEQNVKKALVLGSWAVWAFNDKNPRMKWLLTRSERPRAGHIALVGQVRRASGFPHYPGELINCKCSWVKVYN